MDEHETYESAEPPVSPAPPGPPPGYAPPAYSPAQPNQATQPTQPTRWRDVLFGWRSALAVFVAGIVLGGLAGAAITVIAEHHGDDTPTVYRVPGQGFGPGGRFGGGQPG